MSLAQTQSVILRDAVDLDGLEALLTYMAIGFTFNSSFSVLTNNPRAAIPRSEADRLKAEFARFASRKSKSYLRVRIPLILIGLTQFGADRAAGVDLGTRLQTFKSLISDFDTRRIDPPTFAALKEIATRGLNRRYYTSKLNATLDPVSAFFDGQTPSSFSNALVEFTNELNAQASPPSSITLTPVPNREQDRDIRVLEGDGTTPTISVVEDPLPPVVTITAPEDNPPDTETPVSKMQSTSESKFKGGLKLVGLGILAAITIGITARALKRR
jgi:hypothetical protein